MKRLVITGDLRISSISPEENIKGLDFHVFDEERIGIPKEEL